MADLSFNLLRFSHPEEQFTFHFSDQDAPGLTRVFHTLVPPEVLTHFAEQEHYYMSFKKPLENGLSITLNTIPDYDKEEVTAFRTSILKRYYNYCIHQYFSKLGMLVKPNFVNDTEIWVPAHPNSDPNFKTYYKFCLKVQVGKIVKGPSLLLSFHGKSTIYNTSCADLLNEGVSADCFHWVVFENKLIRFEDLPDAGHRQLEKVFPIYNFDIKSALNHPNPAPERKNKYKTFKQNVEDFYSEYLDNSSFRAIIPFEENGFVKVKNSSIGHVSRKSNLLLFGEDESGIKHTNKVPYIGLKEYGPYDLSQYKKLQFFFIMHLRDLDVAKKMNRFFRGQEYGFRGLYSFTKTPYYTEEGFSIVFNDMDNPLPEIETKLNNRSFSTDVRYIAIYISPFTKNVNEETQRNIYYRVKESLLKRGITSQAIDAAKVNDPNYHYSLPNIAIAIHAKLDGIPWRLSALEKNELIVGIGAFKNARQNVQYIGSAFSFSNNGTFNQFECFLKNQTDELAGSIITAVRNYVSITNNLKRLIIHFYKNMSQEELEPIEQGLKDLDLNIPIFIVSINKTESSDIVAFDNEWSEIMPESGTFISLGYGKFLLFNNTRYSDGTHKKHEGYPFPVKLSIFCTEKELLTDYKTVCELIDQVYQFSRMYWKSVSQQNLPVTIKYPEMVAEIFSNFEGSEIPEFGKSNLWFL
ncbi:Piwi domain-containing protein [Jiulongibacter sp. NS-SX5]|uniref:Piwi domain-containing protein n=1 Tax=Jiulongibacter sp. NS-SX5 TaxID=3463854 RepID=UPI00405A2FE7